MPGIENFTQKITSFKKSAENFPQQVIKTTDNVVTFADGRAYAIYEPDESHKNSNLCVFDFASFRLKYETQNRDPRGASVGEIKVDIKTDVEGNVKGLNQITIENVGSTENYEGILVTVFDNGYSYQARYKSSQNEIGVVKYDQICDSSGKPLEEQEQLKEKLTLPKEFNIINTTMKLLTLEGDLESLRENPFVD